MKYKLNVDEKQVSIFFVQYSISKSDAQKLNVLLSRSASFERTMPCPLTIPKTNKKTFHVISRKKNPNPPQS